MVSSLILLSSITNRPPKHASIKPHDNTKTPLLSSHIESQRAPQIRTETRKLLLEIPQLFTT